MTRYKWPYSSLLLTLRLRSATNEARKVIIGVHADLGRKGRPITITISISFSSHPPKSTRKHLRLTLIRTVPNLGDSTLQPLVVILHRPEIKENLEPVGVFVNQNARGLCQELPIEFLALLVAPVPVLGPAVENDRVLLAADGDVKEDITVLVHKVDESVVDAATGGGSEVEGGGLNPDDVAGWESIDELDGGFEREDVVDHCG